jgi:hypothetical protein
VTADDFMSTSQRSPRTSVTFFDRSGESPVRDERRHAVHLGVGYALRLRARLRAHAVGLRLVAPVRTGRQPLEVDPLAIRRPAHLLRFAAVDLGAAHDVLDRELEGGFRPALRMGGRCANQRGGDERAAEDPEFVVQHGGVLTRSAPARRAT